MLSPWGNLVVADGHAHLFSHSFFRELARQKGQPDRIDELITQLNWDAPPVENSQLADRWRTELDRQGVERSVLMASIPGDEESIAGVVRTHPDRFHGYFMFNPLAPDAVARATRAFDELQLQGICLFPAMHGFSVQDRRLDPLYELAAQRRGVVVFVHMGVLTVGVRQKLGLPSRFDMSLSNPLDLHRIAMENPQVNFILPHFGSGFFRETLMLGDLAPNVYLDTSSTNSWMKYQFPEITLSDVFRKALEVYGPNRLIFGSDSSFFPRGWNRPIFEMQVRAFQEVGIDDDAAKAIFGGNLTRLLKK